MLPTPTIGMIGVIENKKHITPLGFKKEGDTIFLLGEHSMGIESSQYLIQYHKVAHSPAPRFNLEEEYSMQKTLTKAIRDGLISAAHDVADGGLITTLVEMSEVNDIGFDVNIQASGRRDAALFGEAQSRVVIAVSQNNKAKFVGLMKSNNQSIVELGQSGGESCRINDLDIGTVKSLKALRKNTLHSLMNN